MAKALSAAVGQAQTPPVFEDLARALRDIRGELVQTVEGVAYVNLYAIAMLNLIVYGRFLFVDWFRCGSEVVTCC